MATGKCLIATHPLPSISLFGVDLRKAIITPPEYAEVCGKTEQLLRVIITKIRNKPESPATYFVWFLTKKAYHQSLSLQQKPPLNSLKYKCRPWFLLMYDQAPEKSS